LIAQPQTIRLFGIRLHSISRSQVIDHIFCSLSEGRGGWVITPNLDILRRLHVDTGFRKLCGPASLRLADGMPLVWASRLKGTPVPERVAGSDLIWSLCERAAGDGRSVFLLGGNPGTAEAAGKRMSARYPGLRIAGTECPPVGFDADESYLESMCRRVTESHPDIVFVALGSPKQESLIVRLRQSMPSTWFLGIGVTFSFVAGELKRAPVWLQHVGLEWAHRLAQEPRRLGRRYLLNGVPFAIRLFARSGIERFCRGPEDHPDLTQVAIEATDDR
jgi:N-acetylglucosaminyldiphosphoundecaprenol N-acetyl-beta-D-mannosaminyltransferase